MPTRTERPPLPDAPAREAIARDVDVNMVVEAAAGTGKTTSLVARLMTLVRRGALRGDARLAAVTFTHKAASELRERLERELERAVALPDALSPDEIANLKAAAAVLPECHIGTIHSFCARLLRERPVEAGIGLDFRELDKTEDLLLRRDAWNSFAAAMARGEHAELRRVFQMFRLDLETLAGGFEQFANYPDVEEWPGADATPDAIDTDAFARRLADLRAAFDHMFPAIMDAADYGHDEAIPGLQMLHRRWPRLEWPLEPSEAYRLALAFKKKFQHTTWAGVFDISKDEAAELKATYLAFIEDGADPLKRDCQAVVYAAAIAAFHQARDIYDALRRERRELNFQDLLLLTARLLRNYPEVRADLAARFPRLLVDEVQDTDPIQAEIMFLLASRDATERDWRRCPPRPGSLFIVGDPKQSIYRFRRADILVYQEMKRLLTEAGGRVLGLTSNFRSQPAVLDWVNQTYCLPDDVAPEPEDVAVSGRFAKRESRFSPEYMDLVPGRAANPDAFAGVYYLETRPSGQPDDSAARTDDLARRIAAFIKHAVDSELPLPDGDGVRPAQPGDFLVVTYKNAETRPYADAIRRLGLPCVVTSGATLANASALALASAYLNAMAAPDDPILWTAVLRGPLFGVDDSRLYRWKKAGGEFHLLAAVPDEGETDLREIFLLGRRHLERFASRHPVSALEGVLDDLGLWPLACLGPAAAAEAGALAAALEILRRDADAIPTTGDAAERLAWLIENCEEDPLPAESRTVSAVRVMNLHKTKGLEAPVVFLAGARSTKKSTPPSCVIRREDRVRGALCLRGQGRNAQVYAKPANWDDLVQEEALFLAAEKTRLNYVAATRGGSALVVATHLSFTKKKVKKETVHLPKWSCRYLPGGEFKPGESIAAPLPEPEAEPVAAHYAGEMLDAEVLGGLEAERRRRRPELLRESYRTSRAKPEADWGIAPLPEVVAAGMDLGEILHRLLASDARAGELGDLARRLLQEYQVADVDAAQLAAMAGSAKASALWRRAAKAKHVYREAPYAIPLDDKGGGGLERGVIDLVFREEKGWVVVDYKSDNLSPDADRALAATAHATQLTAYARAWRRLTGEEIAETGIYFLRPGEYVTVPVDI